MGSAVYTRTGVLISLCHAKKLLLTHGYDSFIMQVESIFDTTTNKGKFALKK